MYCTSLFEAARIARVEDALTDVPAEDQESVMSSSTDMVDGYLRTAGYGVPIPATIVVPSIKRAEAAIWAWDLLKFRTDPTTEAGALVRQSYEDAILWLRDVAKGVIQPIPLDSSGATQDATPTVEEGGAFAVSEASRGWSYP